MKLLYFFFLFFLTAFLLIEFRLFLEVPVPEWLVIYGKDFICMPIVLTICLLAAQTIKRDNSLRLSLFTIFSLSFFYSIYFEVYLPEVEPRYTADFIDILMYFSGGLLFYFIQYLSTSEIPDKSLKLIKKRSEKSSLPPSETTSE